MKEVFRIMVYDKEIIGCELAYTNCFSDIFENEDIVRFSDELLPDMYYHNCTYIKNVMNDEKMHDYIQNEISLRISENKKFCNILVNSPISDSLLSKLTPKPEVAVNGYYSFDLSQFSKIQGNEDCKIKKVDSEKMVNEILYLDMEFDGEKLGKDFCTRRAYRRGKVYLTSNGVNSFICYHNGELIGSCNLFLHENIAKIEDFAVLPVFQRKGYGTSILKELIKISMKENAHTIYLVTDEEDTAKEMYLKIGFQKIGEKNDLFFKL